MAPHRSEETVLISAAALAEQLHAIWFAVYVVTPGRGEGPPSTSQSAELLERNIKLAETLGAMVVKINAADVPDGLTAFASREGVSHVVVGRSTRSRSIFGDTSTIGTFVKRIRGVELQVVANRDGADSDPVVRIGHLNRRSSALLWIAAGVTIVGLMAIAPWPVMFSVASALAGGWSWWLERRRS